MKSLRPQKHRADVQCQRRPWSSNIQTCFKNRPTTFFYGILKINILKLPKWWWKSLSKQRGCTKWKREKVRRLESFPSRLSEKSKKTRSMSRESRVREKKRSGKKSRDREKSENLHERETINYLVKEKRRKMSDKQVVDCCLNERSLWLRKKENNMKITHTQVSCSVNGCFLSACHVAMNKRVKNKVKRWFEVCF